MLLKQMYETVKNFDALFVEDDKQLRTQMSEVFAELFKTIDSAENGQVGLQMYEQKLKTDRPYDIVITDINMPVMNGIDMIGAIFEHFPEQAVIVISAHDDSHYLLELLHLGVNNFLIKPVQHTQLITTLYKVSQILKNERIVKEHYQKIEALNAELALQSDALKKMNNDLHAKNIALERSMRIIEGMHHKDQLKHTLNLNPQLAETPKKGTQRPKDDFVSESTGHLKTIEDIISDIALEYHYKKIEDASLQTLSQAVHTYTKSLPETPMYDTVKTSLCKLADAIAGRPKCKDIHELERIFSMLESFFFIYSRWQKEWKNIDEPTFASFCDSIESEIDTLIDVWECRI